VLAQQQVQALDLGVQPLALLKHGGELAGEKGAELLTPIRIAAAEHVQDSRGDAGAVGPEIG
jgi:hypothetical protein